MQVTLYTRRGCHLCENAKAILVKHGLPPVEVDIDESPELKARYDCCIPVVFLDGKERFRGRIDERLLRRITAS